MDNIKLETKFITDGILFELNEAIELMKKQNLSDENIKINLNKLTSKLTEIALKTQNII